MTVNGVNKIGISHLLGNIPRRRTWPAITFLLLLGVVFTGCQTEPEASLNSPTPSAAVDNTPGGSIPGDSLFAQAAPAGSAWQTGPAPLSSAPDNAPPESGGKTSGLNNNPPPDSPPHGPEHQPDSSLLPLESQQPAQTSTIFTESIIPRESLDQTFPDTTPGDFPTGGLLRELPALNDPCLVNQLIAVDFDQLDIRTIVKTVSDITGINIIVDAAVSGEVTVHTPTQIRLGELYSYLESILSVKGYAAVPAADHVKIVPRQDAVKYNPPFRIGGDPNQIPRNDSIVTQFIHIRYAAAREISTILTGRMPSATELSVYAPTNTLMITGTSANIHHLARIVQLLDVPGAKDVYTVIHLRHAAAEVLSRQILELMQQDNSGPARRNLPGGTLNGQVHIQANQQTNSLIVTASPQDTQVIRQLVERLDIERPIGTDNMHVVYLKNASAKDIAEALSPALVNLKATTPGGAQPQVFLNPEPGTNSLIVIAATQDFQQIARIIEKLDIVREQVLVELLIVEVTDDNLREIGIDWATFDQAVSNSVRYFGSTAYGIRDGFISGDLEGLAVGAFKEVAGEVRIGAILKALQKISEVNILSIPHVVTSNHRKALVLVGDNIPYVEGDRVTETDPSTPTIIRNIKYKDVGISMEITPHISQGDSIRLEIDSEFTQLIESVTGLSADTPTTAKRQVETEVSMMDGATIIIGGLIRDDKTTLVEKIPLLGDIPLLGELFKFRRDRIQKTNLLLFITPHIMSSHGDMARMTREKQKQIDPELSRKIEQKRHPADPRRETVQP